MPISNQVLTPASRAKCMPSTGRIQVLPAAQNRTCSGACGIDAFAYVEMSQQSILQYEPPSMQGPYRDLVDESTDDKYRRSIDRYVYHRQRANVR